MVALPRHLLALPLVALLTIGHPGEASATTSPQAAGPAPQTTCGDAVGSASITAADALIALRTAVGTATCKLCLCDANGSGGVTAADALLILKRAVALPVELHCEACSSTPEVVCQVLAALPAGTCAVTAGTSGTVLVGDVLAPDAIYRGGQVVIDASGKIVQVGCAADCVGDSECEAATATATGITCPRGAISPGLIDAHDHITFSQNSPAADNGERYEHRHDWRVGLHDHNIIPSPGNASQDQIRWGELRHLMAGTTSLVGSGGGAGLLRNLDQSANDEGLDQPAVKFETFPLDDTSGIQRDSNCNYGAGMDTPATIASTDAYLPHVGEGIDAFSRNEAICLGEENPAHDITVDKTSFIQAVGLTALDYAAMAAGGTGLIWSPRSNIRLYGDTAVITAASRLGILIALGTDWTPTGSVNLLRELRCADSFNQTYLDGYFSDAELWQMVTSNAADATATDDVIGSLAAGKVADISIFNEADHDAHRAVVEADAEDVVLVMRAGEVLYGDANVLAGLPGSESCDVVSVCGVDKQLCLLGEVTKTYAQLQTAVGATYPAFFCGTPTDEPTCVPSRGVSVNESTVYDGIPGGDDADGDGVPDASDNCATVFNPIRPLDDGEQADVDGDDVGDACDPCPVAADTTDCPVPSPTDRDGDGILNAFDNCPNLGNVDQADTDNDNKGDACDACPAYSNPGSAACPATIYDVKDGSAAVGSHVAITNALVTGRTATEFFLQVKETDPGYLGPDFSGVYVYDPSNTVAVGNRVSLTDAQVSDFFGQIQLVSPTVVIVDGGIEAAPVPIVETPANLGTGGLRAAALEGVVVRVVNVAVTGIAPPTGAGDVAPINEYVVDGALRVNDLFYLTSPFPTVSFPYTSLTGILERRNADSKLEPRSAADVVAGTPSLSAFGPALSYVRVGDTGSATFPTALAVTLASATVSDTFVAITSSAPSSLTVVGGGVTVLAGQTGAQVLVNGILQSSAVTLTATLGTSLPATVRVLGAAEVPVLVSLTPGSSTIAIGGTQTLTAGLEFPAPPGGRTVGLALTPASAGTIPASVVVPANQMSATFDYVDGGIDSSVTIDATAGAMLSATVTMEATGSLVLNEIDYDQLGSVDRLEFLEIYNSGAIPVSLSGVKLVLVNGSVPATYLTIDLGPAGTLQVGQYLVVGSNSAVASVPGGALVLNRGGAEDFIQNGAPDGVALVDTTNSILLDALSYEGSVPMVNIAGVGSVNLVEGMALSASVADSTTVVGSLSRLPNASDSDNAATDWAFTTTPTPGAANVP